MLTSKIRFTLLLPAALLMAVAPAIHAEEGMWTFDNPPLKQLAAKYNFHRPPSTTICATAFMRPRRMLR